MHPIGNIGLEVGEALEGRVAQTPIAIDELGLLGRFAVLEADRGLDRKNLRCKAIFGPGPAARSWERKPNASVSAREMSHCLAIRSAPSNCEVIS